MERDLRAASQESVLQIFVFRAIGDVPLSGGHNFQGLVALFEELDRVRDGGRVFEQVPGGGEFLHDGGLRAEDCLAHQILVVGLSRLRSQPLRVLRQDATVFANDGPGLQ
ncbi:unannotated protein [freshwater metagenome]|uniref:Unannotated protein n=1 Tax=freshwater metagenome TaxID=449393 RepID=A0A6J6DS41_9ZZZZ